MHQRKLHGDEITQLLRRSFRVTLFFCRRGFERRRGVRKPSANRLSPKFINHSKRRVAVDACRSLQSGEEATTTKVARNQVVFLLFLYTVPLLSKRVASLVKILFNDRPFMRTFISLDREFTSKVDFFPSLEKKINKKKLGACVRGSQ